MDAPSHLQGVVCTIDQQSGKALTIKRLNEGFEFKLAKEHSFKTFKGAISSYTKEKLEALIACRQIKIGNESVVSLNQLFLRTLITVIESKYVSL